MVEAPDPSAVTFRTASPTLLTEDVQRTLKYYRDVLGFEIRYTYGDPPCYGCVCRGETAIHCGLVAAGSKLAPNHTIAAYATDVYVYVTHVDTLYTELRERGANILREPETAPYLMREIMVEDCNGYRLCFGQDVSGE